MNVHLVDYLLVSFPFSARLSWGKMGFSRHLFLILQDENGRQGFGEGVLYNTTQLELLPYFQKAVLHKWRSKTADNFQKLRQEAMEYIKFEPAISFALDTALWDLEGKQRGKPLWQLLGGKNNPIEITEEIFIENDDSFEKELNKIISHGTKNIKLKVGQNREDDLDKIRHIFKKGKGKVNIKLDANQGYSYADALIVGSLGKKFGVTLFEEPIKPDQEQLVKLRIATSLPIMLDESVRTLEDLKRAIQNRSTSVLNIKLSRLGGITAAMDYVSLCNKNNLQVSFGCSEECLYGMSSILHLSCSLLNRLGTEGIGSDRLNYLSPDNPFILSNGHVILSSNTGLGINENLDASEKVAQNLEAIIYRQGKSNARKFLAREFIGIWKTRADNLLSKLKS